MPLCRKCNKNTGLRRIGSKPEAVSLCIQCYRQAHPLVQRPTARQCPTNVSFQHGLGPITGHARASGQFGNSLSFQRKAGGVGVGSGSGSQGVKSNATPVPEPKFFTKAMEFNSGPFDAKSFKDKYKNYLGAKVIEGDKELKKFPWINNKFKLFEINEQQDQFKKFIFGQYINYFFYGPYCLEPPYSAKLCKSFMNIEKTLLFPIWIVSLYFINKIFKKHGGCLNSKICHKIFLTSTLMAIKNIFDEHFSNGEYATFALITLIDMNFLEFEFMRLIEYDFSISSEAYDGYIEYFINIGCKLIK